MEIVIVILIELYVLYKLTRKIKRKFYNYGLFQMLFLVLQLGILLIYRIELYKMRREVYFSDAEIYWNATKSMLKGGSYEAFNIGYIYYSYIIQLLSPFTSVIWINISNILLISISISIVVNIMVQENIRERNIMFLYTTLLANTLVYYSLFRNLKDSLFLFLCIIAVKVSYEFHHACTKGSKVQKVVFLSILTIILASVRPWGFLIPPMLFFIAFKHRKKLRLKYFLSTTIMLVILITVFFMSRYSETIKLWGPIVLENAFSNSPLKLIIAPLNILIGPGPIRPLFGKIYFVHYTKLGNIATFIGGLFWWFTFPYMLSNISFREGKYSFNLLSKLVGVIVLIFIGIYSLQYGGGLELRFRGVIYFLTTVFLSATFSYKLSRNKILYYSVILLTLVIGGLVFGA